VIDLTAPIDAGRSAAGIALGEDVGGLPRPLEQATLVEMERFDYSSVSVWVRQDLVHQICVRQGYSGKLPEGIGIGSSIYDVESLVGKVEEDIYDNLIVVGYPGWCFETEEWLGHRIEDNYGARIMAICVYEISK
jgi:hypothetical protein